MTPTLLRAILRLLIALATYQAKVGRGLPYPADLEVAIAAAEAALTENPE